MYRKYRLDTPCVTNKGRGGRGAVKEGGECRRREGGEYSREAIISNMLTKWGRGGAIDQGTTIIRRRTVIGICPPKVCPYMGVFMRFDS